MHLIFFAYIFIRLEFLVSNLAVLTTLKIVYNSRTLLNEMSFLQYLGAEFCVAEYLVSTVDGHSFVGCNLVGVFVK